MGKIGQGGWVDQDQDVRGGAQCGQGGQIDKRALDTHLGGWPLRNYDFSAGGTKNCLELSILSLN